MGDGFFFVVSKFVDFLYTFLHNREVQDNRKYKVSRFMQAVIFELCEMREKAQTFPPLPAQKKQNQICPYTERPGIHWSLDIL